MALFDGDADIALDLVDALSSKDVNPARLSTGGGCLTLGVIRNLRTTPVLDGKG